MCFIFSVSATLLQAVDLSLMSIYYATRQEKVLSFDIVHVRIIYYVFCEF